jgi:hypothetical protein
MCMYVAERSTGSGPKTSGPGRARAFSGMGAYFAKLGSRFYSKSQKDRPAGQAQNPGPVVPMLMVQK